MGVDQPVLVQPEVPIPMAVREPEDQDMQVEDAADLGDQMDVEPALDVDMNPFLLSGLSTAPVPVQERPVLFPIYVPKEDAGQESVSLQTSVSLG